MGALYDFLYDGVGMGSVVLRISDWKFVLNGGTGNHCICPGRTGGNSGFTGRLAPLEGVAPRQELRRLRGVPVEGQVFKTALG